MSIKIIIVDDSPSMRQQLTAIVNAETDFEVIGWAGNGIEGLNKVKNLKPDVVILDVEMPLLDGLETLAELMATTPVPVVIFSSQTAKGATTTLRALELGAVDVLEKPTDPSHWDIVRRLLIPSIRAASGANLAGHRAVAQVLPSLRPRDFDVIIIGCSTGGPAALAKLLPALPAPYPLPVVVAQHMPAAFIVAMAARLDQYSKVDIRVAAHGQPVKPGCVWIAPGGTQTTIKRSGSGLVFVTGSCPDYQGLYQPSVDVLLTSTAAECGKRSLTFILTGMGKDGCQGAGLIHGAGGKVIAQDRESSVIYGMPAAVVQGGYASWQLSLGDIGRLLKSIQEVK